MVALADPAGVANLHPFNALRFMGTGMDEDGFVDAGAGYVEEMSQGLTFAGRASGTEFVPIPHDIAMAWSEAW